MTIEKRELPNNVSIREFQSQDQPRVKEFVLDVLVNEFGFEPNPVWDADLEDPDKKYKQNGGAFFLLEDSGNLIGTVAIYPHSSQEAEIKRLYVHSHHRGKRLGKALMDTAIDFCKENRYQRLVLDTWERLEAALTLYKKYGFREDRKEGEQIFMSMELQ